MFCILRFHYEDFIFVFLISLFIRYVKDGRQGQLVEKCRRGGTVELTEKLSEHPVLSWVQAALTDELPLAANTLHSLAIQEFELVTRKKVYIVKYRINNKGFRTIKCKHRI